MNQDDFDYYMPDSKSLGDKLTLNMEFLVRIESPLKLDLVDKNGDRLVKDEKDTEVHFVKFESVVDEFTISISTVWKMLKSLGKRPL